MRRTINPALQDGYSGDIRARVLADVRADIRKLIERADGTINMDIVREMGASNQLGTETILRFAYGETKYPSTWTIGHLAKEADAYRREQAGKAPAQEGEMVLALVPRGTEGAVELE